MIPLQTLSGLIADQIVRLKLTKLKDILGRVAECGCNNLALGKHLG